MSQNHYCVIMAGGIGTRLWPLSQETCPKQFLDALHTGRTFLQMTFDRFAGLVPKQNFRVVTGIGYRDLVAQQLPELSPDQIWTEPCRRNTAPCIAAAMQRIWHENPDAICLVTPSDHYVAELEPFQELISQAITHLAHHPVLLTIGIHPTRPATGYGYIQYQEKPGNRFHPVTCFHEKPDEERAVSYLLAGNFLWNAGIFLWRAEVLLSEMRLHLPSVSLPFENAMAAGGSQVSIDQAFRMCESVSIDKGLLEKSQAVQVVPAEEIGWSDIGTWQSLYEAHAKDPQGNVQVGDNIGLRDCRRVMVIQENPGKPVELKGVQNLLIVDTKAGFYVQTL